MIWKIRVQSDAVDPVTLPLLPRQPVKLVVTSDAMAILAKEGTGRRPGEVFASAFRETWKCLPLSARRLILAFWKSNRSLILVELTTYRLEKNGLAAACADFGLSLRFMPFHDLMPLESTSRTIAHELAHVYHFATDPSEAWKFAAAEDFAVRTAEAWGFPQSRLHEKKRGRTKKYQGFVQRSLEVEEEYKKLVSR